MQDELAGTENRIAVERKRYNDTLQDYNTYVQKFPNNLFAGWAGFKPNEAYFAGLRRLARSAESKFQFSAFRATEHAATGSRTLREWAPHPCRVFCDRVGPLVLVLV